MKTLLLLSLFAFFYEPVSDAFHITEEARAFMEEHNITFLRKKNDVVLYNTDNTFAYRTVVENCDKIYLDNNALHIHYGKGQLKLVFEQGEFIRYYRKNDKTAWDGYRLQLKRNAVTDQSYTNFMFERSMYELQYRVLTDEEKQQLLPQQE